MIKLELANFKLNESEQYAFYRIPKLLFSEAFKDISTDAKVLYGLFLDRMSLSRKNSWCDDNGNVYIIFTTDEMKEILNTTDPTISKLQKELDEIGLIERKRQGQGKPSLIYVKNFASIDYEKQKNLKNLSSRTKDIQNSKNLSSRTKKIESLELKKSQSNNTNIIKTETANDMDKKINDISDVFTPDEINLKVTNFDQAENIKAELTSKGLSISRYYALHPFVKKLYFEKYFTEEECEVISNQLKELQSGYDFSDIAKAFSYSLAKLKEQRKKVHNKLAYFITIIPKNIDIVVKNKTREESNIRDVFSEILQYSES